MRVASVADHEPKANTPLMLETSRLRLRRWCKRDAAPFAAMNADSKVMAYYPALLTPSQALQAIEAFEEHFVFYGYGFWAVELKESLEFVGCIGLEPYHVPGEVAPCVAIGWQLASNYWGRGLALEAAQAVRNYAKNHLMLSEIICVMAQANQRSIKLCERLGMLRDASQQHTDANFPKGHPLASQALYRLRLR